MGARWVRDCPKCGATGQTNKPGDSHARDKILQLNGFDKKSSGVTVAINNYGGNGIEAAGARFAALTFDISADSAESEVIQIDSDERGHAGGDGSVEADAD